MKILLRGAVAVAAIAAIGAACGCSGLPRGLRPGADEPRAPVVTVNTPAPIQHQAKTTLLEDNEDLRDRLVRTLGEKRAIEKELIEAKESVGDLTKQVGEREDAIASLSEQIQALEAEKQRLSALSTQLETDRRTVAEMYALEKKQRLAFEKELLEREIAERTHPRGEP